MTLVISNSFSQQMPKRKGGLLSLMKLNRLFPIKNGFSARILLTIFFCVYVFNSNAQMGETYSPAKVVMPSPTAASLGVYGNTPVSYYSGLPDISIPLYNLQTTNHALAVALRYNSGGTRVGENASWVGLGWSLSAGGVITKTIRGLDDFGNNGYYTAQTLPTYHDAGNHSYFYEMINNRNDGDPDIISYNFGNYSGRFLMGKKADGSKVYMDDRNNLKVEYSNSGWVITDARGYKYYLGNEERATEYYYSSGTTEISDNAKLSDFRREIKSDVTTAWHLDSIASPNSEVIKFIYERKGISLSLTNKSEQFYDNIMYYGGCSDNTVSLPSFFRSYSASKQELYERNLKQIISSQGTIDFITTDREDIEYSGTEKPGKLSEIIVRDLTGKQIKRYGLSYDYFGGASFEGRLKLNQITEYGVGGRANPPYTFTYFNQSIPPKYTKSIDHWGYYNGRNNNELVPSIQLSTPVIKNFPGANREADSVSVYPKAGVLSSITYPTGGSTKFDFELNDYSNMIGEERFAKVIKGVNVIARPGHESENRSQIFSITDTSVVDLSYSYRKAVENANSLEGIQTVFVYLTYPNGSIESWDNWPCPSQPDPTCGFVDGSSQNRTRVLLPGTYKLEVRYLQGYSTSAILNWTERVRLNQRKGAGLRIKSIENFENGKKINVKKFLYTTDGKTTGLLISHPRYEYYAYAEISPPTSPQCSAGASYLARASNSVYSPGLTSKGNIVGYSKVTEIIGENGEGGKTEYFYHNDADIVAQYPFLPSQGSVLNGKLAVSMVYDADGKMLKKADYEYDVKETFNLLAAKCFQPPMVAGLPNAAFDIQYYSNSSVWSVLSAMSETDYINNMPSSVETKKYFYENTLHKELTKEEASNSTGGNTISQYKYPHDVAGPIANSLIAKWQIGTVLEKVQSKNTSFIKVKNDYSIASGTNLLLPQLVKSISSADNKEEVRLRYHNYDKAGNLLSVSPESGMKTNYVWSYKGQYPIAMVKNAEYSVIESLLGGKTNVENFARLINPTDLDLAAFLAPLRNATNLPGAMVNTYSYQPLVGVRSETDAAGKTTYYEYDDFQRLKYVMDQHKNIVKEYCYNYAGQVSPCESFTEAAPARGINFLNSTEETFRITLTDSKNVKQYVLYLYPGNNETDIPTGISYSLSMGNTPAIFSGGLKLYFDCNLMNVSSWHHDGGLIFTDDLFIKSDSKCENQIRFSY